jgi:hypothetical protein
MLDLADDLIWHQARVDIYQWDVARIWVAILIYALGLFLGKVRIHYAFILAFYLFIGSSYVITGFDIETPIFYAKIFTLFFVAILSPSHDFETTGPYGVGYREFRCHTGKKTPISVFYPVEKADYNNEKNKSSRNISRTPNGSNTAKGIATSIPVFPNIMFKYFTQERIQVLKDHAMHTDFAANKKRLKPVFFSPGLVFGRTGYTGICRELASHGMIVYTFDHTDNSCPYYVDTTQDPPKPVPYEDHDKKKHN